MQCGLTSHVIRYSTRSSNSPHFNDIHGYVALKSTQNRMSRKIDSFLCKYRFYSQHKKRNALCVKRNRKQTNTHKYNLHSIEWEYKCYLCSLCICLYFWRFPLKRFSLHCLLYAMCVCVGVIKYLNYSQTKFA